MEEQHFPAYRELANGRSRYRITSPTHMVEVQRVGARFLRHHVEAMTYPERLRIHELMALQDGSARAITAVEFDDWNAQAG